MRLVLAMGLVLSGCAAGAPERAAVCERLDARAECILQRAEAALSEVETPFAWVTAATELAPAMQSLGRGGEAVALLREAEERLDGIEGSAKRGTAASEIALSLGELERSESAGEIVEALRGRLPAMEGDKRADLRAKLVSARAVHGELDRAVELAGALPAESDMEEAWRGRTQREVAAKLAESGRWGQALELVRGIDADFTYYRGVAMTDVMGEAARAGRGDLLPELLAEARRVAGEQENTYYSAGILREAGLAMADAGREAEARELFAEAAEAAREANKVHERARALSRVAAAMADAGLSTGGLLREAARLADGEGSEVMRGFARYEVAGSAAFAGELELARELAMMLPDEPFGSAGSLRGAAERDVAWGLMRAGRAEEALAMAESIGSARERVHALARLARLAEDRNMRSMRRYL